MLTVNDLAMLPGRIIAAELKNLYDTLNNKYFAGALPSNTVTVFFDHHLYPHLGHAMAHAGRDHFGAWIIGIDDRLRDFENVVEILLLHEMIHVELGTEEHGSSFQARFRALVEAGAFDGPFSGVDK